MAYSSDGIPWVSSYFYDEEDQYHYQHQSVENLDDFVPPAREYVGCIPGERLNQEVEQVFEDKQPTKSLWPLKELCCRFVGKNLPFRAVQLYPSRVPEDVQRRISFWSFPVGEKKLLDYAKVMGGATERDVEIARSDKVTNVIQSGKIDCQLWCNVGYLDSCRK